MKTNARVVLKTFCSNIDANLVLIVIVENENGYFAVRSLGMPEQLFETLEDAERHAQSVLKSFYVQ